jgi:hypothetical protein
MSSMLVVDPGSSAFSYWTVKALLMALVLVVFKVDIRLARPKAADRLRPVRVEDPASLLVLASQEGMISKRQAVQSVYRNTYSR